MNYNCEHCGHQFKQKNDLQRHLTKKNGCIPVNQIIEKKEQQSTMNGKIQELHSLFKTCFEAGLGRKIEILIIGIIVIVS